MSFADAEAMGKTLPLDWDAVWEAAKSKEIFMEKEMFRYGVQVDVLDLAKRVKRTEEMMQQVNKRMRGSFVPYPDPQKKAIHAEVVQLVAAMSQSFSAHMVKQISQRVAEMLNESVKNESVKYEPEEYNPGAAAVDALIVSKSGGDPDVPPQFR